MGLLKCGLFNEDPKVRDRLERCLLHDPDHITPGSRGEHVRKIQIALNRLSKGPCRQNFNLKEDGRYGPSTAAAVKAYKNVPHGYPPEKLLQPWQTTPDDIVGKRTIKALDEEMDVLENESPAEEDRYISTTMPGGDPKHDHTKCPSTGGYLWKGRKHHRGTPLNPQGTGRKINIGGERETEYLGFEDFVTDTSAFIGGPVRPLTTLLPSKCASDICVRSSPITYEGSSTGNMGEREINRIARPGCRLTVCSPPLFLGERQLIFLRSLGAVLLDIRFAFIGDEDQPEGDAGMRGLVIAMRGDGFYISQSGQMHMGPTLP
jgi:peptidoglycan hydrolase-like protein with peptidoglycan-binding domain